MLTGYQFSISLEQTRLARDALIEQQVASARALVKDLDMDAATRIEAAGTLVRAGENVLGLNMPCVKETRSTHSTQVPCDWIRSFDAVGPIVTPGEGDPSTFVNADISGQAFTFATLRNLYFVSTIGHRAIITDSEMDHVLSQRPFYQPAKPNWTLTHSRTPTTSSPIRRSA